MLLSFCVRTGTRISLRDKQLFEITEVKIARVDYTCIKVDRTEQTVQTQIRLFLEEQSDLSLHTVCYTDALLHCEITLFQFKNHFGHYCRAPNFVNFRQSSM